MKEYTVDKDLEKKLTNNLIQYLGELLTHEYSTLPPPAENSFRSNSISFDYDDGYTKFSEETLEKFLEEYSLKENIHISFHLSFSENGRFAISFDYGNPIARLLKISPPDAHIDLTAHVTNQIWGEGIVQKFSRLIEEFNESNYVQDSSQLKSEPTPEPEPTQNLNP